MDYSKCPRRNALARAIMSITEKLVCACAIIGAAHVAAKHAGIY